MMLLLTVCSELLVASNSTAAIVEPLTAACHCQLQENTAEDARANYNNGSAALVAETAEYSTDSVHGEHSPIRPRLSSASNSLSTLRQRLVSSQDAVLNSVSDDFGSMLTEPAPSLSSHGSYYKMRSFLMVFLAIAARLAFLFSFGQSYVLVCYSSLFFNLQ